jgi:very-short-patch-repair endonuclease
MVRINRDVELMIISDYKKGIKNKEIIKKYAIGNTTLFRVLKRNEIGKKIVYGLRVKKNCLNCNKTIEDTPYNIKITKYCSKDCADKYKRGKPLVEFFGVEKARKVTETAKRLSKNNKNLNKFTKGSVPWNKDWDKGSYFSEKATASIKKGQLKVAQMRKGKTLEEWFGKEGANQWKVMQSKSHKGLWNMAEYRRKQVEAHLGQLAWNKGKKWEELFDKEKYSEMVEKNRKHMLKLYSTNKFPKQTHTDIEMKLKKELTKRGFVENIHFIHQFKLNDKFLCDFAFHIERVIAECDGDWHHANPSKYDEKKLHPIQRRTMNKDKSKDAYIRKIDNSSWTLIRFWGADIHKDVSKCVDAIEEALNKKHHLN